MKYFNQYISHLGRLAEGEIEKKVRNLLPQGEDMVYLDLGCGDGSKTLERAAVIGTKRFTGVELEQSKVDEARKKKIKIYKVDLNQKWPFASSSIDCITATEVIEHLVDLDRFLSEIKRVLKPNGTIIISSENLAAYHNILALLLGNQPYTGPYLSRLYAIGSRSDAQYYDSKKVGLGNPHLNVMTIKALVKLLQKSGFTVKNVQGAAFYPWPPVVSFFLSKIDKNHSSYGVVSARK